jgi:hypothetical protein
MWKCGNVEMWKFEGWKPGAGKLKAEKRLMA